MKLKLLLDRHFWWDLKYKIECFFNPEQEWLTEVIPDTYCDKVELIPRLLFKCLEHYVEVERKQEYIQDLGYDWAEEVEKKFITQEQADTYIKRDKEVLKAYNWIKTGRVELEKQIDDAYPPLGDWSEGLDDMYTESEEHEGFYEMKISDERRACYREVARLEDLKLKKDKKCMRVIIKHYEHLWT